MTFMSLYLYKDIKDALVIRMALLRILSCSMKLECHNQYKMLGNSYKNGHRL